MLEIIILCLLFLVVIFFVLNFTKTVAAAEPVHTPPPPEQLPQHECSTSKYGCCANEITPNGDSLGINCVHPDIHVNF